MASEAKVKKVQEHIYAITETSVQDLVTNPSWGKINFHAAQPSLDLIFSLCNHLKVLPIEILPDGTIDTFSSSLNQTSKVIASIRSFDIENGNPTPARDEIVNSLKNQAENLLVNTQGWIAFLAYQRGDVQKNIDDLNRAVMDASKIVDDAKIEIAGKKTEISEIVTAAREASASAGVGVFTTDFEQHATTLTTEAESWLKRTVQCAIGTLLAALISIFIPIDKDASSAQIFQLMSSKLVVLLILLTATVWCGRIYKALLHQISVAKHRANALKTFQAFVKAASNDSTRDAVLLETTRSIFASAPSGYLDSADAGSEATGSKILEVVKTATSSTR